MDSMISLSDKGTSPMKFNKNSSSKNQGSIFLRQSTQESVSPNQAQKRRVHDSLKELGIENDPQVIRNSSHQINKLWSMSKLNNQKVQQQKFEQITNFRQQIKSNPSKILNSNGGLSVLEDQISKKRMLSNSKLVSQQCKRQKKQRHILVNLPLTKQSSMLSLKLKEQQTLTLKQHDKLSIKSSNTPQQQPKIQDNVEIQFFQPKQETPKIQLESLIPSSNQSLLKNETLQTKLLSTEQVEEQIHQRLKSRQLKLLNTKSMIEQQYKKKTVQGEDFLAITSGLNSIKSSSVLLKDFNSNSSVLKPKIKYKLRAQSIDNDSVEQDNEPKVLCSGVFCHEDQSVIKPGYHYDTVFSQYIFLKDKKRIQEPLSILAQLNKDYYLSQHQIAQQMFVVSGDVEEADKNNTDEIHKTQHHSLHNLPEISNQKFNFYKSAMINQYKEEQKKVVNDEEKKHFLEKLKNAEPKKIKLSRKQKRLNSIVTCMENRGIKYPDNRKWIGLRRILSDHDETTFGIQKNSLDQLRRYFTHTHTFFVDNQSYDAELSYEYDHKQSKFISKEKSLIMKLGKSDSNWKLKLDTTHRKNLIDKFSSKEYLKDEIMLSEKQSIGLEFLKFDNDLYQKGSIELAIPEGLGHYHGMPSFFKLDGFLAKTLSIIPNKLKLTGILQGGFVIPTLGCKKTTINDRFFLTNSFGYTHLGHIYHSNSNAVIQQDESSNYKKKITGDDLGSNYYSLIQTRLEFLDIPFLNSFGMKTFTYLEAAFYPQNQIGQEMNIAKQLMKFTRFSAGFGFSMPMNQQISILLFYNAFNFNSQKGDFERKGFININIGFF
ncbi:UNKNOWN [Stylonychia lemnae]|uniref:Uncharacterized protein n=1 Tax=Stylonychia lemnae TaxID=5949 RepID=A0A078B472_STYLE|nr:UNKNOWN [Stylonychia lemnae]|eukprot:CDW88002.1 UNKNOWN [Stylonychia lemnae]